MLVETGACFEAQLVSHMLPTSGHCIFGFTSQVYQYVHRYPLSKCSHLDDSCVPYLSPYHRHPYRVHRIGW